MTEIIDTVFKVVSQLTEGDSDNVVERLVQEAFPQRAYDELQQKADALQILAEPFQPLRDSLDPEARPVKLAWIKLVETVLDGIRYNCPEDHLDDLAAFWLREPEAVSKGVIAFLEKNACPSFAALGRVAAAQMAPPEPVSPPPEASPSQPDRKLRTLLDEFGLKPQGGPLFI